jgi:hypothetical protein
MDVENKEMFGFAIIGDYLFIKKWRTLEYLKIFTKNGESIAREATLLNLNVDSDAIISRLVATE